jgi:SpoVK/Ycf46/Vps4 family AAA+-type ATPase
MIHNFYYNFDDYNDPNIYQENKQENTQENKQENNKREHIVEITIEDTKKIQVRNQEERNKEIKESIDKKNIKNDKNDKNDKNKENININIEINNINDLLSLIEKYPLSDKIDYNINMISLHKIKEPLIELNNMIGMKNIKENILYQLLYFIQDMHKIGTNTNDFMHTIIYGIPGTGKTEVAKIIGKIFANLGILKKGTFKKVTRNDLIAGYLGQTAIKTKAVINESLGGVLFIDEVYSLGNIEKRDSFSKECIDTLCEALSDKKDELMVIIAGYEKEINECFFSYNEGLSSRFTWRFNTDEYNSGELYQIFKKKVENIGWNLDNEITSKWFDKNKKNFKFQGRDMEILLFKTKIVHSKRVFCQSTEEKTKIIVKDLEKGLELFLKNNEVSKNIMSSIYI